MAGPYELHNSDVGDRAWSYQLFSILGCLRRRWEKKRIRSVFKHNLADNVVESVGERKRLTVLFSDIFSFTDYLVKQPLEEAYSNLCEYFTEMVDVILRYGGMIDKFMGDEMMVDFGVPTHFPDHAERACLVALEMVRSFKRLRERWVQEGKEIFNIKIGINTGDMIVGNIGSNQIFDYSVIGAAVTLGVRLRDINKVYLTANHIIISEFTKNELSDKIVTRELDSVRAKGLNKPMAIFELVSEKDSIVYPKEFLVHFTEGLERYKKMEWDWAIKEFSDGLKIKDDEVSSMYIKRCRHYKENPPIADWDGVFTLRTR